MRFSELDVMEDLAKNSDMVHQGGLPFSRAIYNYFCLNAEKIDASLLTRETASLILAREMDYSILWACFFSALAMEYLLD